MSKTAQLLFFTLAAFGPSLTIMYIDGWLGQVHRDFRLRGSREPRRGWLKKGKAFPRTDDDINGLTRASVGCGVLLAGSVSAVMAWDLPPMNYSILLLLASVSLSIFTGEWLRIAETIRHLPLAPTETQDIPKKGRDLYRQCFAEVQKDINKRGRDVLFAACFVGAVLTVYSNVS